ncbi:MAG: NAD(P)-dependent oxidoreductase [Symploca sp. SIO1A3]|nr:NAD(P)-dependent oxidoreductase [Symploca sp. SIO1A3]
MTPKRIFLTGASGCIGHYITEALITETEHELYLLVRDPDKLGFDYEARSGITIFQGDLREISQFGNLLKTMDVAILTATAWGGAAEVFDINVIKTIRLMELLNPKMCEQVIYFSTSSILDRNNQLLREAGQLGTDYIRSKYDCLRRLSKLAIAPKITTLFPTLVLGGLGDVGKGNRSNFHPSS